MYPFNSHKVFIFTLFFPAFILPLVISNPIPDSPYEKFILFLLNNNCTMPKELKLPFTESSDPSPFSYLSTPLSECRTPDASKEFDEAHMLCTEIFDVLKNVTCGRYESLPMIESGNLSTNVCQDFAGLKYNFPRNEYYLSGKLSDKILCKVFCTAEKYESLCKTLFWSYETLMKIDIAVSSKPHEKENENVKVSEAGDTLPAKPNPIIIEPETSSKSAKEPDKSKTIDNLQPVGENTLGSNPEQTDKKSLNPEDHNEIPLEDISNKIKSTNMKVQDEAVDKSATVSKTVTISSMQDKPESNNQKLSPENIAKLPESKNLPNLSHQPEHIDDDKNKNDVDEKLPKNEANDDNPQTNQDTKNLTSDINGINENQKTKNATLNDMPSKNEIDINSKVGAKLNGKSEEESNAPATGNDNELKSNNFPEEDNKSKAMQTNSENQEGKEIEKPKQSDYESPNELLPDSDSKLPEPSTQLTVPDEDIEHPEDKDKDQYNNDIENEGDYPRSDYDNSFNLPPKNKGTEVKNSIAAGSNQMANGYDNNMGLQNSIGQISGEIAMSVPFPDQEDSHFFFYFLTIVLVIMAGYLLFHNKQKIIALIVEGRHERRRRSHGAGYKKLETK